MSKKLMQSYNVFNVDSVKTGERKLLELQRDLMAIDNYSILHTLYKFKADLMFTKLQGYASKFKYNISVEEGNKLSTYVVPVFILPENNGSDNDKYDAFIKSFVFDAYGYYLLLDKAYGFFHTDPVADYCLFSTSKDGLNEASVYSTINKHLVYPNDISKYEIYRKGNNALYINRNLECFEESDLTHKAYSASDGDIVEKSGTIDRYIKNGYLDITGPEILYRVRLVLSDIEFT